MKKQPGDQFPILKGAKMPPRKRSQRALKYPWDKMEVGDSIFVKSTDFNERAAARCSAYAYGKRKGWIFRSRVTEEGIGVWRVA